MAGDLREAVGGLALFGENGLGGHIGMMPRSTTRKSRTLGIFRCIGAAEACWIGAGRGAEQRGEVPSLRAGNGTDFPVGMTESRGWKEESRLHGTRGTEHERLVSRDSLLSRGWDILAGLDRYELPELPDAL